MKRSFFFSFQGKVFFVLFLLLSVPGIATWLMVRYVTGNVMLNEKSDGLLKISKVLEKRLIPGGYDEILREAGAESASREEKIAVLNRALRDVTDEVASVGPGLGVGYYSLDLDAIVTYGPSSEFGEMVGRSIAPDHPGHEVMRTNMPQVRAGTMVRGKILNAMQPIQRGGRVIGYVWTNELSSDIERQFETFAASVFAIIALSYVLTIALVRLLSRRMFRDIERIIGGLRNLRSDLSVKLEPASGWLGDIVDSINTMAADVLGAKEETERAISAMQGIMSNVDAMVYVCDPATKELVYVNGWLQELLKCGDVKGQTCYESLYGRNSPCEHCPHERFFTSGGEADFRPIRQEIRNNLVNRDFLVTDRLVTWHDGRTLHLEIGTDITERKALLAAEAANSAQREFLARMSHEIRTPMNGVLGMTHLAMQASPPPEQYEYLKKIQSSATLLLGIINDILDFSKIEAGKLAIEKHPFNLREMVEGIKTLILPKAEEKGLTFIVDIDDFVPNNLSGDELRLSQVLLNLLSNAAKFTSSGSIELRMTGQMTLFSTFQLECAVKDSGIGITASQLDSLFKPFTQADSSTARKFGGTGLGLSISKALVELMGGDISVKSEFGQGSTFSFSVVLDLVDELSVRKSAKCESVVRFDGKKFLLAEDNIINQEIAVAILSCMGAKVDVVNNGQEGVDAYLHGDGDYDLILMDIRMPTMDGLEATRRIRESGRKDALSIPIVAMTANAMTEDREESKRAGMSGHVSKPIDIEELTATLHSFLSE
ncbi:MAG: response regulator, partial [Synergistaceae bacterium]|nr:response regulator [Synergistaceae bacterium]